MNQTFEYKIKEKKDCIVISLSGNLMDRNQATVLLQEVNNLIAGGQKKFIINLKLLKFMNSSGISCLITILTKARNHGGEAVMIEVAGKINELLVMTKLNTVFKTAATEKDAEEILAKI